MKILVGSTGFVGGNLLRQTAFDRCFHSTDVHEAFGLEPDLLVYCGVKAEKFVANVNVALDLAHIHEAFENIKKINPRKLVLISTIDVYENPINVDECTVIEPAKHSEAYGRHRGLLEQWVLDTFEAVHIVRLPALFGEGLKKNFIYDVLNPIPVKLTEALYQRLSLKQKLLESYYVSDGRGFYVREKPVDLALIEAFKALAFSSVFFTDSRARFQFYDLAMLWKDLEDVIAGGHKVVNLSVAPLVTAELYSILEGKPYENIMAKPAPSYDMKSIYAASDTGYHVSLEETIKRICAFVEARR